MKGAQRLLFVVFGDEAGATSTREVRRDAFACTFWGAIVFLS